MRKLTLLALPAVISFLLTGCYSSQHADSARSAAASVTADPTVQAEMAQARALVASCFPGTPLQQAHTVHLVFLARAAGKNGPAVVAARDQVFGCLHISDKTRRQAFTNAAAGAALHASPELTTQAGRQKYFSVTLPQLVLKYGGTAAGMGTSTAQPSIPGVPATSGQAASS